MKLIFRSCIAVLLLSPFFAQSQCTTTQANTCLCPTSGSTDCDLLPDISIAKLPLNQASNYTEYPQVCNPPCSGNDGRLRIGVSTPIIGYGPLETRGTSKYLCGTDTIDAGTIANIPAICPGTGLPPKQLINQRIYHKQGNTMTFYDRPAGTMTYHPTHGHQHVDDWGIYTLRTNNGDPNPLNWPILGTGAKLGFCLLDISQCNNLPGYCTDSAGNTLNSSNIKNYGLGGGAYSCSNTVQGITNGYMDTYSQGLDGMWINLPPGICNGTYWVVVQIDPRNYFLEINENNNVVAVPINLTQQGGTVSIITANGPTTFCPGSNVILTSSLSGTYQWSNGANSRSITVTSPGTFTVTTTDAGANCSAISSPITVSYPSMSVGPASPQICTGDSIQLFASTGEVEYQYTVGNGSVPNSGTTYPAPYGNWYWGARHQFLIKASELIAANMTAGAIDALAFNVSAVNGANVHNNFTIRLGTTMLDSILSFQSGLITVKQPSNYQPVAGWNTHIFNTEFNWNGSSNIIVEICFQNSSYFNNGNATVLQSSTSFKSTVYYRNDASDICGNNAITATYFQRPNMLFSRMKIPTYSWTPSTGLSNAAIGNPYARPASTTLYTVSSNCSSPASVTVTVTPLDVTASASPSSPNCNGDPIQLMSSVASSGTQNDLTTFENNQPFFIPDNNATGVTSPITLSGISPPTLNATSIVSVEVNITHTWDGDLLLTLISPSGNSMFLSNRQGNSGDNFTKTVFTMSATIPIGLGVPPYSGTFIPDGNFSSLTGNVNGIWQLKVQDLAAQDVGSILSWNITINRLVPETFHYQWSSIPAGFTSTQQNPTVNPTAGTMYSVIAGSNSRSCIGSGSTAVSVPALISINNFSPSNGTPGTLVTLNGSNFTGVSNVTMAGVQATSFTVVNANQIQAVVPNAAEQSGLICVTNSNGCTKCSNGSFAIQSAVTLNLKVFIEGLYLGNRQMTALLYARNLNTDLNVCDSITLELHNPTPPYALAGIANGVLKKDGTVSFLFPISVLSHSYFLAVRHRNSLETWSKNPVLFDNSYVSFDFTSP